MLTKSKKALLLFLTVMMCLSFLSQTVSAANGSYPTITFATDDAEKFSGLTWYFTGGTAALDSNNTVQATISADGESDYFIMRLESPAKSGSYGGLFGFTVTVNGITSDRITTEMVEATTNNRSAVLIGSFSTEENKKITYDSGNSTNPARIKIRVYYEKLTVDDPDMTITWYFNPEQASSFTVTKAACENGDFEAALTNDENTYTLTAASEPEWGFDHWEKKSAGADDSEFAPDEEATAQGKTAKVTITEDTVYLAVFAPANVVLPDTDYNLAWYYDAAGDSIPIRPRIDYSASGRAYLRPGQSSTFGNNNDAPIVGDWCIFTVPWDLTGYLYAYTGGGDFSIDDLAHKLRIRLYAGEEAEGEPRIDTGEFFLIMGDGTELSRITPANDPDRYGFYIISSSFAHKNSV